MPTDVTAVFGPAILQHLEALARLRIAVFREWPYLYDGEMAYEEDYLRHYAACPDSIAVLALADGEVVGASTGLPLSAAEAGFREPFAKDGPPPDSVYYFGESVLLPAWRGRGIGHSFFDHREAQARRCGARWTAFCAVDRSPDDPRRPADHRPLDPFWRKRGYRKHPELRANFRWREVGGKEATGHSLTFWLRELQGDGARGTR
jgi:GNAT superfamily N-acetyltransferase